MKNNLPKILLITVISILIFPQVSFAAWWNPFTWKIFNRTPTEKVQETKQPSEIEKLRSEVEELKKKVATPVSSPTKPSAVVGDKSKAAAKPVTPVTKPVVTATELKKQNPQEYKALIDENKTKLLEASKLLSNKNIIARVKPSVVYIETAGGSGSGIVISADGYVLTNAHVVSGANSATVKLADGGSYNASVAGRDENTDLALLKISASGLSAAFLGNSDLVEQGDPVFTFGYPLGIEGDVAFKDGTLSRRQKINGTSYLEISAQILPGNSGGPLVNQAGEVIGVNTLALGVGKVSGVLIGETLKYALPINVAKGLIPELKNGRNIVVPKITLPSPSVPNPQTPAPTPVPVPTPNPEPTPPPVPKELPPFEFNPQVSIEPGAYQSGYGTIRVSILEPFSSCLWLITQDRYVPDTPMDSGTLYPGSSVVSKQRIGEYKYNITCFASGYTSNKKTGSFKITEASPPPLPPLPPEKITATIKLQPHSDAPELQGEFKFSYTNFYYNNSGSVITSGGHPVDGSITLKIKIQVMLNDNATSTNQLTFYNSSKNSTWQSFFNIKNGDILEINQLPGSQSLLWSFSDNPDYLSLKIVEGTATKDGQNIPFEF